MTEQQTFYPGFGITPLYNPLGFAYGDSIFGPIPENRTLEAIRPSLLQPDCDGPDIVYSIAMDVGERNDRASMAERNLLYGAVTYARGLLGREPVRSQGHIHAISPSCGMSTCEVYEIWSGTACVYMQETAEDNPGRCYAVIANPGETVIVPPGWAHCTIVANPASHMTFGAWCVRDYGFDYTAVRRHKGLAWFPVMENKALQFIPNPAYTAMPCEIRRARSYPEFGLTAGKPIYTQFQEEPDRFLFVSKPQLARALWQYFEP